LQNHTDVAAQGIQIQLTHIHTVDADGAFGGIIEAGYQVSNS
jgi:hypothetical protein